MLAGGLLTYTTHDPSLWLGADDIQRVAEFFDCDVSAALEFARKVWLPDARQTALRIAQAVLARDSASLLYLCDHLREGARTVGADRIVRQARTIERAVQYRNWCGLLVHVAALKTALQTLSTALAEYAPA